MRIALGMITKSLDSDIEILRFVEYAEKYGHKLDCVIAAYALKLDPNVESRLNEKLPLYTADIRNPRYCMEQFRRRGISDVAAKTLLECPVNVEALRGVVPYGFNRTIVTIEAILRGIDILFFVDSDVIPSVLKMTPNGIMEEEVDFFGSHLEQIKVGSHITTGEYSGYNILPPALFEGMEELLLGLQKSDMFEYWRSSETHRCLTVQQPEPEIKPCTKILGGNTAITIDSFSVLPPFLSSYYMVEEELFLCRGEDTVLGLGIAESGLVCTDIGLNPLHDTYSDYPAEPDLKGDAAAQIRFYYACTGWVGRNPFLNHIRKADLQATREFQRERLEPGLRALADYTSNPRYFSVLNNFDVSWNNLGRYVDEYQRTLEAWGEFIKRSDLA